MKVILTVIKFIFKIIAVFIAITAVFAGIIIAMLSFSNPRYYTEIFEKAFIQGTGQQLKITGDMTLKPGKALETTINSSIMTVKTKMGDVKIITQNLFVGIPWSIIFERNFENGVMRADQVIVEIVKDAKVVSTYSAFSVATNMKRTCCDLQLNDLKLTTKEGDLSGQLILSPLEKGVKVTGKLHAKSWTLNKPVDPKKKVITFEGIKDLEGVVVFMIDVLHTPQGEMHNAEAVIDLGAKTLTIQSSHVNLTASKHSILR